MWDYTPVVKDHFLNPRNVGDIPDADAVGEVGSLACGDALKLYLKLDESAIVESEEVRPGVVLDFNADDQVVGIEILGLGKRMPADALKEVAVQVA